MVVSLGESGHVLGELAILLNKVNLNMEPVVGVDLVLVTWSKSVPVHILGVVVALSTLVTPVVMSLVSWGIAGVWSGLERVLVGLHDVELWAEGAANLVGITVVVTSWTWDVASIPVLGWHSDEVEGGDTAALHLAEVHIEGDLASEEVWHEEVVWSQLVGLVDGHAIWATEVDPVARAGVVVAGLSVEGLGHSIDGDIEGLVPVGLSAPKSVDGVGEVGELVLDEVHWVLGVAFLVEEEV